MSSGPVATGGGSTGGGGAVGGALSLMGCVREASPPPQDHHPLGQGDFGTQRSVDTLPKEPKKRRFHPLRGLRRIFRRKSRGAADARLGSRNGDRDNDLINRDREEVTLRNPAGHPEEARSRSASELLTDSCDRESVFLRRSGAEESFAKLRGVPGQLSVSHDSVFPGEVPHTRPLSSLDPLATLERRQTKVSDEGVHKDYSSRVQHGNRISLRVLEQIKTVIENRNQLASATSTESTHVSHQAVGERYPQETTENRFSHSDKHERTVDETLIRVTRNSEDVTDREALTPKEDLPELECASLNHTAAHHRISVRPKNRRPPRRTATSTNVSGSTITTISESPDAPDSLENPSRIPTSPPIDIKIPNASKKSATRSPPNTDDLEDSDAKSPSRKSLIVAPPSPDSLDSINSIGKNSPETIGEPDDDRDLKPATRKSSNRISKNSNVYDELESKLPRRRSSSSRLSKSPDSLEIGSSPSFSKSTEGFEKLLERDDDRRPSGKLRNSVSKSTETFDKLENVEIRPIARRLRADHQMSKSIEGFDRFTDNDDIRKPARRFSNIVSRRSNDGCFKCADSLETIGPMISDDSIEQRRSSFESGSRKSVPKLISMSSENFVALEHAHEELELRKELKKRSSASDVNLSRGRRYSRIMSKSTESLEAMEIVSKTEENDRSITDLGKIGWPTSKRIALSSESSDNLELDDRLENRRSRRPPKRIPSTSIVDIFPLANVDDDDRRPTPMRKPSRLQKSSESSELGSTDTLDSDKRNKSYGSDETLDSLEKDNEQDVGDEEIPDNVSDKRDKNDSWSARTTTTDMKSPTNDATEDSNRPPGSPEKSYWHQTSDSKENMDIHQLLAITIVTHIGDNGNNQRNNSVAYPKKKQQQITSPPDSPVVQQDDNKILFNNLLATKNDEDLQNMLNGNISAVSTDTKSFKEKLIMFEKLGK